MSLKDNQKEQKSAITPSQFAKRYGLTHAQLKQLGVRRITQAEATRRLGYPAPAAGWWIPYDDLNGKATGFGRIRFDFYEPSFGAGKAMRYAQAKSSGVHVYFPKVLPWDEIVKDTAVPILLSEGEFKAASASVHGFVCIGIGGVTMWAKRKQGFLLHPDIEPFVANGRTIVIVFDSDANSNPQVLTQQNALAAALTNAGARVFIVQLPSGDHGEKVGLDDFIIARGREALNSLIEAASEWASSRHCHELNAQYCVLRDSGRVYEPATQNLYTADTFINVIEANRKQILDANTGGPVSAATGKTKVVNAARYWIESKMRREYSGRTYAPGKGAVTDDGRLNLWRPSEIEPREGDVTPYLRLLENLVPDPNERAALEAWVAYALQNPGERSNFAVMLWGTKQGTGKSLIAETFARLHGEGNFAEFGQAELESPFNSYIEGHTFMHGSEISGERGARQLADLLKSLITAPMVTINRKNQPTYAYPNTISWFFTSNHDNALFLDNEARRYLVLHADADPLPSKFYAQFVKWRDGGGLSALLHRMLTLDLTNHNAKGHAPKTRAREAMVEASRTPIQRWVQELREDPNTALAVGNVTTSGVFFTTRELCSAFSRTTGSSYVNDHVMGRALRAAGFVQAYNGNQIPLTSGGRVRLWIVRNSVRTANMSATQIAEAYEGKHRMGRAVA